MTSEAPTLAVTGASGRLGQALLAAAGARAIAWRRPELDLDRPAAAAGLLERDRPSIVIHPAGMTDVDACARDPATAMRRNGEAAGAVARVCADAGIGFVLISTNEVFDGERTDGAGYRETDEPRPRNPYGASKLAGELVAAEAYGGREGLWIVRTVWLYGPPRDSFPEKIVAAADRLPAGEALPVVTDEFGSPTSAADLAAAILRLIERTAGGTFHLANAGHTSRAGWAERVLATRRPDRTVRHIGRAAFERASDPPPWGVLDCARAAAAGVALRAWEAALDRWLAGDGPVSSAGRE